MMLEDAKVETRKRAPAGENTAEVPQVLLGVILFILVAGLWACLWVPPFSIF